jgi:hypothetical protein
MSQRSSNENAEFLATGLKNYLDAKSAVSMFEMELQRRIKEVVTNEEHVSDLSRLFGQDWKDYLYERPNRIWVGQKIVLKNVGGLYLALFFARETDEERASFSPVITFWREKLTQWKTLWERVEERRNQHPALSADNWTFSLVGAQPAYDWHSCQSAMVALVGEWIELWRKLEIVPKAVNAQEPVF